MKNSSSPLPSEHRALTLTLLLGHVYSLFKGLSLILIFKEDITADNPSLPLGESSETHLCDPLAFEYEYRGSTKAPKELKSKKKDKGIVSLSIQ